MLRPLRAYGSARCHDRSDPAQNRHVQDRRQQCDFIVEDPAVNMSGTLAPFATWGQVIVGHMEVRVGERWLPAGELRGSRIDLTRHDRAVATTGPLLANGTSFVATQIFR
jgi:hypothetical protein